jgi:uncharacterized protein with PQ loop repeat
MSIVDVVGWSSSAILVVTLFVQVRKQWHDHTSRGVSPFLFVGQLAASLGFLAYSVQIESWVFVATNALTSLAALCGLWITLHQQPEHA